MKLEQILTDAGVQDAEIIQAIKTEVSKHFIPSATFNERLAGAKKEAEDAKAALEAFKAEVEAQAEAKAGEDAKGAAALKELQKKFSELETRYNDSQTAIKQRDAKDALGKALEVAGANPAAVKLLINEGMGIIEFGEDGKPANVEDVTARLKDENGALFGEDIDTSKPLAKPDKKNQQEDDFLAGFNADR